MASMRRSFLRAFDIPCANFAVVSPLAELQAVLKAIGFPHVLNLAMSAELGKQEDSRGAGDIAKVMAISNMYCCVCPSFIVTR
jgi:hypothetical protein